MTPILCDLYFDFIVFLLFVFIHIIRFFFNKEKKNSLKNEFRSSFLCLQLPSLLSGHNIYFTHRGASV